MDINILRKEDGYSVIENPDKELVEKIKAIKPSDTFDYSFYTGCEVTQNLGGGQFLVKDDEGEFITLKKEDIDSARTETLLTEINKTYLVWETLNTLPTLYTRDGFSRIEFNGATKEDIANPQLMMRSHDSLRRVGYSKQGLKMDTYNGFSIMDNSDNQWSSIAFAYFDTDGNIRCRDYNIDIGEMAKNESKITKELILQELTSYIKGEEFQMKGNKFYSDKWCYVVSTEPYQYERDSGPTVFSIKALSIRGNNRYGTSREGGTSTLPKKTTPATKQDILSLAVPVIMSLEFVPGDISGYAKDHQEQPQEVEVFNVKKYKKATVYDYSNPSEDEYLDHVDKKTLSDLEQYCLDMSRGLDRSSEIEKILRGEFLDGDDIPNFSFEKGEAQPDHSDFVGLIKLPHGCRFTFEVEEGDACEITWAHSIYQTDIVFFKFVGIEKPVVA